LAFGCTDMSLVLQVIIQQARLQVEGSLYILWVDLATFFPKRRP